MERRAHRFVQKPTDHGESLQVNRYWPGEKFSSHADYFPQEKHYRHIDPKADKMLRRKRCDLSLFVIVFSSFLFFSHCFSLCFTVFFTSFQQPAADLDLVPGGT